jgi:predicted transcriptional regulator
MVDEVDPDEIAELDRQWAEIEAGAVPTVPHEKVARWLETWGTAEFKPWSEFSSSR